eukprot:3969286-Prymnesium_polylepis.1
MAIGTPAAGYGPKPAHWLQATACPDGSLLPPPFQRLPGFLFYSLALFALVVNLPHMETAVRCAATRCVPVAHGRGTLRRDPMRPCRT